MTKITADHLARGAFVYIRQSTSYHSTVLSRKRSLTGCSLSAWKLRWLR